MKPVDRYNQAKHELLSVDLLEVVHDPSHMMYLINKFAGTKYDLECVVATWKYDNEHFIKLMNDKTPENVSKYVKLLEDNNQLVLLDEFLYNEAN